MRNVIRLAALAAGISLFSIAAHAQSGTLSKAVGGYSFEDAAKEAPAPRTSTPRTAS